MSMIEANISAFVQQDLFIILFNSLDKFSSAIKLGSR